MTPERWRQVEELYHSALAQESAERRAFLDKACDGDSGLRREVESLLAHEALGSAMLEPARRQAAEILHGSIGPGTRFGPYSIVAALGAGGMGEVYRARDTRLDRTVALKVLPEHLRDDPQLKKRFEREARAVSSLNHPHICTLYDIGTQDGIDYLVMEYLEGETLAQRMAKGPLPLDQVLEFAIQIADALAQAHRLGVFHRDLKPGNIMLTKPGAKLLDFGLAKVRVPASAEGPTETDLTEAGTILGTLHYMAPEQLEGKTVDATCDIFSFGAVLYEMATGRKAFTGESRASVIASILSAEPSISALPAGLERIVKACLAKKPEDRWQGALDLARELKWVAERESTPASGPPRTPRIRAVWVVAGLLMGALAGWLIAWRAAGTKPAAQTVVRLSIPAPEMELYNGTVVALSPDGTQLAYAAGLGANSRLYLRRIDRLESTPIRDSEFASHPFFSPDGQWIGFFANRRLKKAPITGGATQTICATPTGNIRGVDWGPDDTIFFGGVRTPLWRVPASGGTPQLATTLDTTKGEIGHRFPKVLPGGKEVIFTIQVNISDSHIAVESLATHHRRRLTETGTDARYASSGHLVYAVDGSLMASPFDLRRREVTAAPIPVLEKVNVDRLFGNAQFAFSETGSLVYVSGGEPNRRTLAWVDRQGAAMPVKAPERLYEYPRLSPDGQRVAVNILDGASRDVWIYDLAREVLTRLTYDGRSIHPEWTPDGKRLVYGSTKAGTQDLFIQAADGSGAAEKLLTSGYNKYPVSWALDGRALVFVETSPTTSLDAWVLPLEAGSKPRPFIQNPGPQGNARISPDGRWLAYSSNESGRGEVYVTSFPSGNGKWQVSDNGSEPIWARNGRELFYRDGDKLMAVEIEAKASFTARKPRVLFARSWPVALRIWRGYDVALDGQRFLLMQDTQAKPAPSQLNVVVNWFEELRRPEARK